MESTDDVTYPKWPPMPEGLYEYLQEKEEQKRNNPSPEILREIDQIIKELITNGRLPNTFDGNSPLAEFLTDLVKEIYERYPNLPVHGDFIIRYIQSLYEKGNNPMGKAEEQIVGQKEEIPDYQEQIPGFGNKNIPGYQGDKDAYYGQNLGDLEENLVQGKQTPEYQQRKLRYQDDHPGFPDFAVDFRDDHPGNPDLYEVPDAHQDFEFQEKHPDDIKEDTNIQNDHHKFDDDMKDPEAIEENDNDVIEKGIYRRL